MTIPPVGRERDILIAEIKGWNYDIYLPGVKYTERNGIINLDTTEVRAWSIKVQDAWELWEELPFTKTYKTWYWLDKEIHLLEIQNFGTVGDSSLDVVSKKWIEFKDNRNDF